MSEEDVTRDASMEAEGNDREQEMDRAGQRVVLPEDGYEWRKYGQKFIRNVGKIRSYFKCQNPNCGAKKKADWDPLEPHNIKVVYEGVHRHASTQESTSSQETSSNANRFNLYTQVFGDQSTSSRHLSPRSDVYSFGVALLELLTGRKSLDKSRPAREQNLIDWALPMLKEKKKVLNIVDPRLEGDYPIEGVHKAAMLAYHCLNRNPKAKPLMRDIMDSLEPLQVPDEVLPTGKVLTLINEVPNGESKTKDSHCN